jgi:hypothetical protein
VVVFCCALVLPYLLIGVLFQKYKRGVRGNVAARKPRSKVDAMQWRYCPLSVMLLPAIRDVTHGVSKSFSIDYPFHGRVLVESEWPPPIALPRRGWYGSLAHLVPVRMLRMVPWLACSLECTDTTQGRLAATLQHHTVCLSFARNSASASARASASASASASGARLVLS